ncbi:voltage-gated inwardly rectifying potassium channel KCNH7-like isoform X1 [Styela clava]
MRGRKGVLAPQNSFLNTIATRFYGTQSCFILGSAQIPGVYRIVYCSDGFCKLTGHPQAQVMQKSCTCSFLYGKKTNDDDKKAIWDSLNKKKEFHTKIMLYRKDGSMFECLLDIDPIRDKSKNVIWFMVCLKNQSPEKVTEEDASELEKSLMESSKTLSSLKKDSDCTSLGEIENSSCMPHQRRRSRAVLYSLSGHIERKDLTSSRINSCASTSNLFTSNGHRALEYEAFTDIKKSVFIVLHYSITKILWDWIIFLCTLYVAATVPYYAALQTWPGLQHLSTNASNNTNGTITNSYSIHDHCPTYVFDVFLEFIFIFDILLSFRTTFVDKMGQIVSLPKQIAINYVKSTFIVDLITAIPFDFISHLLSTSWKISARTPIAMLKTVRLARVLKLYKKIDNWSQYRIVVLFMLMFMFGMVAHWMACIWFGIGWSEFQNQEFVSSGGTGWVYELSDAMHLPFYANNTGGPGVQSAYLTSLYFTLSSLTSVGFGNVSANTNVEKIFSICVMIIGAIMHAVVFGSINAIIQRMYEKRSEYDRNERNLKDFIRARGIPKPLKTRMIETFQAKWALNKGVNEEQVMKLLPDNLRADVTMHLHKDLLNLPVFKNTDQGCKRYVSLHAGRRFISPGDTFVHVGDPLEYVYLLCSGSLEVSRNDIVSAILSKDDLFGSDILNDKILVSFANVKALTFCEIQCLSIEGLRKIKDLYPEHSDIIDELRAEFSCQLWEEIMLNTEEIERQTKIESWNQHYSSQGDVEDDSDNSSCVFYPAVTINLKTDIEKDVTDQKNASPLHQTENKEDEESEVIDSKIDEMEPLINSNTNPTPASDALPKDQSLADKLNTQSLNAGVLQIKRKSFQKHSVTNNDAITPAFGSRSCFTKKKQKKSVKKRVSFHDCISENSAIDISRISQLLGKTGNLRDTIFEEASTTGQRSECNGAVRNPGAFRPTLEETCLKPGGQGSKTRSPQIKRRLRIRTTNDLSDLSDSDRINFLPRTVRYIRDMKKHNEDIAHGVGNSPATATEGNKPFDIPTCTSISKPAGTAAFTQSEPDSNLICEGKGFHTRINEVETEVVDEINENKGIVKTSSASPPYFGTIAGLKKRRRRRKVTQRQSDKDESSTSAVEEEIEKTSSSSPPYFGTIEDLKKRRRRRKVTQQQSDKDESSTSSLEEDVPDTASSHKVRRPSVVEMKHTRERSPNSRKQQQRQSCYDEMCSRHCNSQLEQLKEKFDDLQNVVMQISVNMKEVLTTVKEMTSNNPDERYIRNTAPKEKREIQTDENLLVDQRLQYGYSRSHSSHNLRQSGFKGMTPLPKWSSMEIMKIPIKSERTPCEYYPQSNVRRHSTGVFNREYPIERSKDQGWTQYESANSSSASRRSNHICANLRRLNGFQHVERPSQISTQAGGAHALSQENTSMPEFLRATRHDEAILLSPTCLPPPSYTLRSSSNTNFLGSSSHEINATTTHYEDNGNCRHISSPLINDSLCSFQTDPSRCQYGIPIPNSIPMLTVSTYNNTNECNPALPKPQVVQQIPGNHLTIPMTQLGGGCESGYNTSSPSFEMCFP